MDANVIDDETLAPINQLPEEILERIFAFTSQYNDYVRIGLVCKKWHRIINGLIELNKNTFSSCFQTGEIEWECIKATNQDLVPIAAAKTEEKCSNVISYSSLYHPQQRHSHACALLGNNLYIFGGLSSTSTAYNDLWVLDLNMKTWSRASTSGSSSYPSPKAAATMLARSLTRELFLYGGYSHPFIGAYSSSYNQQMNFFDELHVFSVRENAWRAHVFAQDAPKLAGHSASFIQHYMILFGGCNSTLGNKSNSVYCLDLNTYTWINVLNAGSSSVSLATMTSFSANVRVIEGGPRPEARYGHSQVTLDSERILIVGGCGGPNKQFEDVWVLHWPSDTSTLSARWEPVQVRSLINAPAQHYYIPFVQCCQDGSKLITFGRARIPTFSSSTTQNGISSPMTIYGTIKQPRLRICSCSKSLSPQKITQDPKLVQNENSTIGIVPVRSNGSGIINGEVYLNKSQMNTVKRLEVLKKFAEKICNNGNNNANNLSTSAVDPESTFERNKQQRRCVIHSRLMQVFVLDLTKCIKRLEMSVSWQSPIAHFSIHTPPETTFYSLACGIDEIVLVGGIETDSNIPSSSSMRPSSSLNEYVKHRVSNKVYIMRPRRLFHTSDVHAFT